jgi:hypothetical protein
LTWVKAAGAAVAKLGGMNHYAHAVRLSVAALLLVTLPQLAGVAWSAPTITCHCFQDRQFDPARPLAADPYLLATVQNRLIGYLYQQPRQDIVRSKMGGLPGDRLWVSSQVATAAGRSGADALQAQAAAGSWREAVAKLGADPEHLGPLFMARLAAGADEAALAEAVIDQVLNVRLAVPPEVIAALRSAGVSGKELVAAAVLAGVAGRHPVDVYQQAREAQSWGQWLTRAELTLPQVDAWLAATLAQTRH